MPLYREDSVGQGESHRHCLGLLERQAVRSWIGQVLEGSASASGSLAYRTHRKAIWRLNIPEKYTRLVDLAPGRRVLELGAAEGVLSLLWRSSKG
jgi:hypothetical protein